jgi:hypothetical protein
MRSERLKSSAATTFAVSKSIPFIFAITSKIEEPSAWHVQ